MCPGQAAAADGSPHDFDERPGPADQASDGYRRAHKAQQSDRLQTGGGGLVCDGACGRETFVWTRLGRWPCSCVHHTDRIPAEAAPLCAAASAGE